MCRACLCSRTIGTIRQLASVTSLARGCRLLLATRGDAAGMCAMHVLSGCMDTRSRPRFARELNVVFIDSSVCLHSRRDASAVRVRLTALVSFVLASGFGLILAPLTAAFHSTAGALHVSVRGLTRTAGSERVSVEGELRSRVEEALGRYDALCASHDFSEAQARLEACFEALHGGDAAQDMVASLTTRLQLHLAVMGGYQALATCETLDDLAVDTFMQTCRGRGATLPLDVAHSDVRWMQCDAASLTPTAAASTAEHEVLWGWYAAPTLTPNVVVPPGRVLLLRPLADVEVKEAALYCHHHRLPTCAFPTFHTLSQPTASMYGCTTQLLRGLQAQAPQTVHTIVRTVRKLQLPALATTIALSRVDEHAEVETDAEVQNATASPCLCVLCGAFDAQLTHRPADAGTAPALENELCYACRAVLHDMLEHTSDAWTRLPSFSREAAAQSAINRHAAAHSSAAVDFDALRVKLEAEGLLLPESEE